MKRYYPYTIIWLFALVMLATSCEKEEPDFYDKNENGVYFDYNASEDFQQSINFADHVLGNPQELTVNVNMKLLGYMVEGDRKAVLKTKAVEGYPEATVTIPEVVFTSEEYEKTVEISVARPDERDTDYAVCIYLDSEDPESQLGDGIAGKEEFIIYVKEAYTPAWTEYDWCVDYLGPWSVDKHIFFINLLENNDYASAAKLNDWYGLCDYNLRAVNALRQQRQENPDEPITIDIPFRPYNYDYIEYPKPYYWGDKHDEYLGAYSASAFTDLAVALGVNTANEVELLGDETVLAELYKSIHQGKVTQMMNNYNTYFTDWFLRCDEYQWYSWVEMSEDFDYQVVEPYQWQASGDMIAQYYGAYSAEKYKFMIKTWLKEVGSSNFVLVQMFPVYADASTWPPTVLWDERGGGEDQIKKCYKVFKAAYDAEPAGTYNFTFPELNLE